MDGGFSYSGHHGPSEWNRRVITGTDRAAIIMGFYEAIEEDPELTKSEYARRVCGKYSVTARTIRQILADVPRETSGGSA